MRTETINIYQFDELSDDVKEKAHERYLESGDWFFWFHEWQDSLNAFCSIAPVEWIRFDVTAGHIDARFTDSDVAELEGRDAWKWLNENGWFPLAERNAAGECTLTGYCGDCDLFDPIHKYSAMPDAIPTLEEVFYECLQSWVFACRADEEHHATFEHFEEMCEMNKWEFYSNGKMV